MSPYKLRERVTEATPTKDNAKKLKMAKVSVLTNDGKKTQVDLDIAKQMEVINDMIETLGDAVAEDIKVDMKKSQLKSIVNYLMRAKKSKQSEQQPGITAWERRFFNGMDRNDFFGKFFSLIIQINGRNITLTLDCLNAADYIGVPALVDHGTTYVAEKISGKQPSEVAEFLNVKEDFPKETIDELTQMLEKIEKPENNGQETAQNENDDRRPEGEETKE